MGTGTCEKIDFGFPPEVDDVHGAEKIAERFYLRFSKRGT
jgi:hypothetical protein